MTFYSAGSGTPPVWALVLEAAGYDPLRAQQLATSEELTQEWWARWLFDRNLRIAKHNQTLGALDGQGTKGVYDG